MNEFTQLNLGGQADGTTDWSGSDNVLAEDGNVATFVSNIIGTDEGSSVLQGCLTVDNFGYYMPEHTEISLIEVAVRYKTDIASPTSQAFVALTDGDGTIIGLSRGVPNNNTTAFQTQAIRSRPREWGIPESIFDREWANNNPGVCIRGFDDAFVGGYTLEVDWIKLRLFFDVSQPSRTRLIERDRRWLDAESKSY